MPIAMLGSYNFATTGSPFRSVYTLLGHQNSFVGDHFGSYALFYAASLAIFPLAGWVVFSPKWARGWTLPATSAAMVLLASLYYYRDGLNVSASAIHSTMALLAGAIPGQRFLIPVSMVGMHPGSTVSRRAIGTDAVVGKPLCETGRADSVHRRLRSDELRRIVPFCARTQPCRKLCARLFPQTRRSRCPTAC